MLRLMFTVCSIGAPDTCEQRELLIYEDVPVMACMIGAMPELATWQQTHPNWRIARWRCEDDRAARAGGRAENPARPASHAADAAPMSRDALPVALPR